MSRLVAYLALVVAVASIGLNVFLLTRLNQARVGAIQALDRVSTRLDDLAGVSVQYTARVKQTLPVSGELPFNQDLVVPISTTIPISVTAHASVNTPLGPLDVPVAVDTSVPINLQIPINISRTVPYSLTIPIDLAVPFEIHLHDLGVDPAIQEAKQEIQQFKASLQ
ncbi:MAG: hypothetical protein WCF84_03035 [Anaerolineae bacterium]